MRADSALFFPAGHEILQQLGERALRRGERPQVDDVLPNVTVRLASRSGELAQLPARFVVLAVTDVFGSRLNFRVDVAEDLGDAVVHFVCDAQPFLCHRQRSELLMQMRVVDGDRRLHGEALERFFVARREELAI